MKTQTFFKLSVLMLALAIALAPSMLLSQGAPTSINVQGKLTGSGGGPITAGNYSFAFKIFDAQAAGTQKWPPAGSENHILALDTAGIWNALLGQTSALNADVMDDTSRWLEIVVTPPVGPADTFPRFKLTSNPFTLEAGQLGGKTGAEYVEVAGDKMTGQLEFDFDNDANIDARLRQDAGPTNLFRLFQNGNQRCELVGGDKGHLLLQDNSGDATAILDASTAGGGFLDLRKENGALGSYLRGGTTADGATLDLRNSGGSIAVTLNAQETQGGILSLNQEDGTIGITLDAGSTTAGDGGILGMFNAANFNTVTLDAIGTLSQLALRKEDGTTGTTLSSGSTAVGSTLTMRNAAGSATISLDADGGGTAAVVLPPDAISDNEIDDEPGVASDTGNGSLNLSGAVQTLLSRTITAPTSGYALVIGTVEVFLDHVNGTLSSGDFGVSDASGSFPSNQDVHVQISSAAPTGAYFQAVTVHSLFSISAGANTFYLLGDEASGILSVVDRQLTVIFFPTAYGTVFEPSVAAAGNTSDENLPQVSALTPQDIAAEQVEAEKFNAARIEKELAQIKAERAELEARLQKLEERMKPENR